MDQMQKARGKFALTQPFLGPVVVATPMEPDPTCKTAWAAPDRMGYNPEFIASLEFKVVMFVLAHEIMHIILKHSLRRQGRHAGIWNKACDYRINYMLKTFGFEIWEHALFDNQYADLTEEQIYSRLMQDAQSNGGEDQPEDGLGDDVREPAHMSPEDVAKAARQIDQIVSVAVATAKVSGSASGAMEKLIGELLSPAVPWVTLLQSYMLDIGQEDESWAVRNTRYPDIIMPSMYSESMGELVMLCDASGSIGGPEFQRIGTEISYIADTIRPSLLRVLWCDTDIRGEQVFDVGEPIDLKPMGGGGTDMRVGLEYIEQFDPTVAILITDCFTPWPDAEPPYPLIVVSTTDREAPIGRTVNV